MKKPIEEILEDIKNNWDKRQGWAWRVRNKLLYNFMRNLYDKGMPKTIPDPSIDDEDEEFSFYAKNNMQLGLPGEEYATRVDYDGQIDTAIGKKGGGKYLFYVGDSITPIQKRIWTLTDGYLPEINYQVNKNNIAFTFRAFQYWVEGKDGEKTPVNFIQVDLKNLLNEINKIPLYFGVLFSSFKIYTIMISHPRFNKKWDYHFDGVSKAFRDNKLLYISDNEQKPSKLYSKLIEDNKNKKNLLISYEGPFNGNKQKIKKDTKTLIQKYDITLSSKEEKTLIFKVPHYPVSSLQKDLIENISNANIHEYREKFKEFWENILEKCMKIQIPEEKVTNTHKTSLIYNFMCQNYPPSGTIEQHVNRFQYNAFWIRDSSFYSRMYSMFNRTDVAKRLLRHFLDYQDKKGNFCSQPGQLDGWGQTLWAFGEYIKLSDDSEFAEEIFGPLMKAIQFLKKIIDKDNWGIIPPRFAADNEMISGRYTGHNFWAWCGLNNAIYLAKYLKRENEQAQIELLKQQFLNSFIPILNNICETHNNRIPPGLDTDIGEDWSNLLMIYPMKLLELEDHKIRTTLKDYRKEKMPEGIAMWMVFLHHYITERIAQQHLILDDQELVLRDLYSMLSHTGSCHEGFEHNIKPWGNRYYLIPIRILFLKMDYFNFPPHGWFAVTYNSLLRNLLIREEDNDLHLISAISPEWMNGNIQVDEANTYYGLCSLQLIPTDDSESKRLVFKCGYERGMPEHIVIHIPYWADKNKLEIYTDLDYEMDEQKTKITLKPQKEIVIIFRWYIDINVDLSYMSYQKAVNWLKAEYKRRYELNK